MLLYLDFSSCYLCAMVDGELLGLGQAVGLEHVVEGLLHVSLLAEPAGNQHIQL